MFTWKRLFLSLGFLFLIAIMVWATWYFTVVHPKLTGEPVKLYKTKPQITAKDKVDTAIIEKSQKENDASETQKHPEVVSQPESEGEENAAASPTQKESDQHAHPDTHQHSKEDLARWAKEIKELRFLKSCPKSIVIKVL